MYVYILIVLILIGLIFYVIDSLFSLLIFLEVFFIDTFWGLASIICGGITVVLFYASSKTYVDSKIKESFLPNPRSFPESIKGDKHLSKNKTIVGGTKSMSNQGTHIVHDVENFDKEREIDLAKVTMDAMLKKMAYIMTKPGPIFFKGWGNRRLELDVERVYIIKEYIDAVKSSLDSYTLLRADALISFEKIQKLANTQKNELLYKLKQSELDLTFLDKEYEHKAKLMDLEIEGLEMQLFERLTNIEHMEAKTTEILKNLDIRIKETDAEIEIRKKESDAMIALNKAKSEAEIYVMKLKAQDNSKLSKQRAKILTKIIDELQLDNITPTEVYLLVKLMEGDSGSFDYMDFDRKSKLVHEEIERMKLENKKLHAETKFTEFTTNRKMGNI